MSVIHRASSNTWGGEACARVCKVILEANDGMVQQVIENRTDLLDILSVQELLRQDDLGLGLPYLAVYHDRPKMLEYLHRRGVDLGMTCDPVDYGRTIQLCESSLTIVIIMFVSLLVLISGTPMYYAVTLQKHHCVQMLDLLGYSVSTPCTKFDDLPKDCAKRLDDELMLATIAHAKEKEYRAVTLFLKNYWKSRLRRKYLGERAAIQVIQRVVRGFLAKRKLRKLKKRKENRLLAAKIQRQSSGFSPAATKGKHPR